MAGRVVCCLSCLGMVSELFEGSLKLFSKIDCLNSKLVSKLLVATGMD